MSEGARPILIVGWMVWIAHQRERHAVFPSPYRSNFYYCSTCAAFFWVSEEKRGY